MIAMPRDTAQGRLIQAGRVLAGFDQNELATRAGVSGSTVSNAERGRTVTEENIKAIRRALRQAGVNLTFGNDMAIASIAFVDRNVEDDE